MSAKLICYAVEVEMDRQQRTLETFTHRAAARRWARAWARDVARDMGGMVGVHGEHGDDLLVTWPTGRALVTVDAHYGEV